MAAGRGRKNCLLIKVESPIELSHFVAARISRLVNRIRFGVNLAVALCPIDTLAGLLLSRLPRVVSARRGLMIVGGATLRGESILYRSVLLPLSEHGVAIDYMLGAANYHSLHADETLTTQVIFRAHLL
jgi:hypothetical protein